EWIEGAKKIDNAPIKIGFGTTVDPSKSGMRDSIDKAVERASERKRNKQVPWLKEVENEDARRIVRKMREDGTIEHSGVFLKDEQVNSVLSRKQKNKRKVPIQKKTSTQKKGSVEEWVIAEEKKSLKRKKNLANIAKIKNAQGEMKNANNAKGIGEHNRKVA
ncbi:uncharacterized protein METZ01_LOCUS399559, partial [marine metagenome]